MYVYIYIYVFVLKNIIKDTYAQIYHSHTSLSLKLTGSFLISVTPTIAGPNPALTYSRLRMIIHIYMNIYLYMRIVFSLTSANTFGLLN